VLTSQKGINSELKGGGNARSLEHSFKKVSVSHAHLAHFSTLAEEKHMLLTLNFSTLTFITNARTTMPFARLHSQMVCTQSEPAEIPQHMFVRILVQVGGDKKRRTTLRTPTPLVTRHCLAERQDSPFTHLMTVYERSHAVSPTKSRSTHHSNAYNEG